MSRVPVFTDKAPKPLPVFNQAIVANGFVYTSGSIAQDPETGKVIDGDIQAHTVSGAIACETTEICDLLTHE